MCLHNGFDQTETQPKPTLRAAFIPTVQAIPNLREFLWRNAHAGIGDGNDDVVVRGRRDLYASPTRRIFDGII